MSRKVETTCELVRRNAAEHPDTPFLNFYDEIITYRELDERTNAFANYLLEKGVRRGDVVSYMLGNSPAVFDVLLGTQKIGAIAGPISCWWQANEVEYLVNDSRSKVLLVDPEYVPIAAEIADAHALGGADPGERSLACGSRTAPRVPPGSPLRARHGAAPGGAAAARGHRGADVHLGDHRESERGDAEPPRRSRRRPDQDAGHADLGRRPGALRAAALPLRRPQRSRPADHVPRGDDRAAAELLRVGVLGLHRALPDQRLLHRAHHVEHPAPGHRVEQRGYPLAPLRNLRCGADSAGAAGGVQGTLRRPHPRGLRSDREQRRDRRQHAGALQVRLGGTALRRARAPGVRSGSEAPSGRPDRRDRGARRHR